MAVSQRQPRDAFVTVLAPFAACSLWHDHNPVAVYLLRESLCFAGRPLEHEHCCGKIASTFVMRRDFDGP